MNHTVEKREGFKGERMIVLPTEAFRDYVEHPLVRRLYLTDVGFFPCAQDHYRERKDGIEEYILIYCTEGKGVIRVEGREYHLGPNQAFCIPRWRGHRYWACGGEPWSILWVHFKGEDTAFYPLDEERLVSFSGIHEENRMMFLFDLLFRALEGDYTLGNFIYLSQVLSLILGELYQRERKGGGEGSRRVTDIVRYMVRHLGEPLTLEQLAQYIACGLDPEKNTLFIQSHVPAHAELGWVLNCYTMFGELSRMTQFKDKSAKNADNINGGLFTYPALMAADILLYQPDYVPVGNDQKQHVELTRDVAERFNHIYGDVFKVPEPYIPKVGARVMSLSDPGSKMSKSDKDPNGSIYLMEKPEDILRKFKRAVTDSDTEKCVRYAPEEKPGVSNLMAIYSAVTGKTFAEIEAEFDGQGYGAFKPAVGEAVVETLRPIREEAGRILKDKAYLESVYKAGAEKASYVANKTLRKVYKKVGFVAR